MRTFADPHRCPECGTMLPATGPVCPRCRLDLTGPLGQELFTTLSRADVLLAQLRDRSAGATSATTPAATAPEPALVAAALPTAAPAAPSAAPTVAPTVAPTGDRAEVPPGAVVDLTPGGPAVGAGGAGGARLSAASVPRILLGLGALCLLVAGLVFLAVTWSVMGVGGRTATLVALTAAVGLLTWWTARRALRGATEALGLVTLGLAALDVVGARTAGWLGTPSTTTFAVVLGVLMVAAGLGATAALARTPVRAFTCGELVAVAGTLTVSWGLGSATWADPPTRVLVALLAAGGLSAAVTRLLREGSALYRVAFVGVTTVAALLWTLLVLSGLDRLGPDPSVASVWGHLDGWPLLAAAAVAAALAAAPRVDRATRRICLGAAILVLSVAATVPAYDEVGTTLTLTLLGAVAVLTMVLTLAPRPWAPAALPAAALGSLYLVVQLSSLGALALERYVAAASAAWEGTPGGRLEATPSEVDLAAAWTLPLIVLVLAAAAWSVARLLAPRLDAAVREQPADRLVVVGATLLALTLAATLVLHPVPVLLVLVVLLGAGAAATVAGLVRDDPVALLGGGALLAVAQPLSWYDAWLTLAALAVAVLLAGAVHAEDRSSAPSRPAVPVQVAGAVVPPLLAGVVWTAGHLVGADEPWTALVALLVVAALGVGRRWLPGGGRAMLALPMELGAVVAALGVGVAGVAGAPVADEASWTAVYLTVGGTAASAMALLRADRRAVGWLGGALLALATWVRLADLGVQAPEPYTLPSAVALLVVGWVHLRRHPAASTARALTPGLALALVPSLLWALDEPLTLRAALLGVACLALVLAGVRLRWAAPLVHGAVVGALLVLREAAPYVGDAVPRWALIGAAGAVLIALGITWEQRLRDARAVAGYVRALR
jgi:hypothetical protein